LFLSALYNLKAYYAQSELEKELTEQSAGLEICRKQFCGNACCGVPAVEPAKAEESPAEPAKPEKPPAEVPKPKALMP
jgi:hypothetical protein